MSKQYCYNCIYVTDNFKHEFREDMECRRNAPVITAYSNKSFPKVNGSSWCGEWKIDKKYIKRMKNDT